VKENNVHLHSKPPDEDIKAFRDRFNIPYPGYNWPTFRFIAQRTTPRNKSIARARRRKALWLLKPHRRVKADESLPCHRWTPKFVMELMPRGREISNTQAYASAFF
jgi:pyruvate dehydrogenase E1 component